MSLLTKVQLHVIDKCKYQKDPKIPVSTLWVQHQHDILICVETAAELKSPVCYLSFSFSSWAPLICTMTSHTSPSSLFLAWSNPIHTNGPLPLTFQNWTCKDWLISTSREDLEVKTPETIITCNCGRLWLKSLSQLSALLWSLKTTVAGRVGRKMYTSPARDWQHKSNYSDSIWNRAAMISWWKKITC